MKSIKNILIGLAVTSIPLTSCTNLDETIYDELAAETIDVTDTDNLNAMMGEAYAQFRFLYWGWNGYFDLCEECSDTYMTPKRIGVGWGDLYINMHKHNWTYSQGHLEGLWNYAYVGIGYCNKCLDILPEEGNAQAQMRFLRAINYYILLDAFRNVPLETTQNVEDGYLPKQVSADTIFNFCVSELNAIKDDLGTTSDYGIPNRYAACMTLAKLYLNANVYLGTDDDNWYRLAKAEVDEVINSDKYELAKNYSDCFKADLSTCNEIIFAIPLDSKNASHNYLVNKCLVGAGAAAYGYSGSPWNGSCAVPQFIDTYDDGDKRKDATWTGGIQYEAVLNSDGTYTPQAGDPIAFSSDDWYGEGVLNYKQDVHSIDNPGAYQQEGFRFVKEEIVAGDKGTYGDDVPFYRLADAYFIKAECLLRLEENEDSAALLVSAVRARAFESTAAATRTVAQLKGGSCYDYGHREYTCEGYANWDSNSYVYTKEGGSDIILGGLLDDLAWEFVGEHHRRQDLIRFKISGQKDDDGNVLNVFNGKSWFCKDATSKSQHWDVFPIPESAMKANISLVQNKGYSN